MTGRDVVLHPPHLFTDTVALRPIHCGQLCIVTCHPLCSEVHCAIGSTDTNCQGFVHIFYKIDVREFCYWVICPTPPTGGILTVQFDRAPSWTSPTHPSFPAWPPSVRSSHSCASLKNKLFVRRNEHSHLFLHTKNIGICFCIYMPQTSVSFDWHGWTPAQLMHCICEHLCSTVSIQTSVLRLPLAVLSVECDKL